MVRVSFLAGLKEAAGHAELSLAWQGSLSGLLHELAGRHGQRLCRLLFNPEFPDERNPWVKILVNGADVKDKDPLLQGDETIQLFLPIAGG